MSLKLPADVELAYVHCALFRAIRDEQLVVTAYAWSRTTGATPLLGREPNRAEKALQDFYRWGVVDAEPEDSSLSANMFVAFALTDEEMDGLEVLVELSDSRER